ncbi:MAG: hypothetical protein HDT44_07825, partial [Ruminococcaceae bacterium]|nr:hypothetical protein [Oscillospiraceae bacterium]
MRDKDIKNIINKASEGEEFSVSSEDIRNALMERIGKRGNMQANEGAGEGEIVEPIIVTARKEKKYSFVKIMAGVAAACLGIGIIGAAAYNGGFGGFYTDQLPTYDPGSASDSISDITSDNISDIDPASSTENNAFPPQTESAENTDTPNTVAPVFAELQDTVQGNFIHEAIKGGPDQYEITLLDGTVVEVKNLDETYFSEGDNDLMPISKVWDKMYFTAYGNKIDITDKMSADEYFCVSYT